MDWKVFQTDVLDALKQYENYFDFFERTGTLSDNSRPDCVARVSRENQKIWIFDAKNKDSIDEEDEKRMKKYVNQIKQNPLDVGLEFSELGDHEIKPVFITRSECSSKYEVVSVKSLHQHLRKELVYTETSKVVRDIAQMAEKNVLTHNQARMLYRSLDSFRSNMDRARKTLKEVEKSFTALELKEHPLEDWESLPVDFILEHPGREKSILLDVPYRESKASELEKMVEDENVVYVVLGSDSEYGCSFGEFEEHLMRKLGIMSWKKVSNLFTPKIPTKREFEADRIQIKDSIGLGYKAEIKSSKDVKFDVKVQMPEKAVSRLKDQRLNSRKDFGRIDGNIFKHTFSVKKGLEIEHSTTENYEAYLDTVNSVFQSGVNPYLSKKVTQS